MAIERKQIVKPYLLLCEGKDAEIFLINYLNSSALSKDRRFSNDIQVLDFGGNTNLKDFLINLMNMDHFEQVTTLAIIRDAEKDYKKATRDVCGALEKCGFMAPNLTGTWTECMGVKIGFTLFPLNNHAGTLEDLCLRILSENNSSRVLSQIDTFLSIMKSSCGRNYHRIHKNRLHTYLSSSDAYVTMPLGMASSARAFDWDSPELEPLRLFLINGFC